MIKTKIRKRTRNEQLIIVLNFLNQKIYASRFDVSHLTPDFFIRICDPFTRYKHYKPKISVLCILHNKFFYVNTFKRYFLFYNICEHCLKEEIITITNKSNYYEYVDWCIKNKFYFNFNDSKKPYYVFNDYSTMSSTIRWYNKWVNVINPDSILDYDHVVDEEYNYYKLVNEKSRELRDNENDDYIYRKMIFDLEK